MPARAAVSVPPGETHAFSRADGGKTECRVEGIPKNCTGRFRNTDFDAANKRVVADFASGVLNTGLGLPNVAHAAVYNDFSIPGSPDTVVDVQISVKYDFDGVMGGGGAYEVAGAAMLLVEDISASPARAAGSMELFRQDRSGDQGLTDISTGVETYILVGESASFQLKLRRGRTYRLWFSAEALAEILLVGTVQSSVMASWSQLSVTVDEDEVEQLDGHDADIKAVIDRHDADIKAELAEIKDKLGKIEDDLAEIKRLLITPQGRRPGFPLKDTGSGTSAVKENPSNSSPVVKKKRPGARSMWRFSYGNYLRNRLFHRTTRE
jgi:hypothetical protein